MFYCTVCHKKFDTAMKYTRHRRLHREKTIQCPKCPLKFTINSSLKRHLQDGHRDPSIWITCEICLRQLGSKKTYDAHMKTHLNDHDCDICGIALSSRMSLVQHKKFMHSSTIYECRYCCKKYVELKYLKIHEKKHEKYKCTHCEFCTDTQRWYFDHMKKHSIWDCDYFGKAINTGETVVKTTHKDEVFGCEKCGKNFTSKCGLVNHERIHNNERPFSCTVCLRKFRQKSALKMHMRLHTGEKPYKCNICNKDFISRSSLTSHSKFHSKDT